MDETFIGTLIGSTLRVSTPLILCALAGTLSERAGVIDLGLEGKMLMTAFAAAAAGAVTGSLPLALLAIPWAARTPLVLAVAFVLLRIFDIGKPFPCRQLEKLPAGLGIMADDWAAAAWTAGCLAVARWQHWL